MSIETWEVPFEAYNGDEPFIFISYAHKDHKNVYDDLNILNKKGYRLWYDEGIDPGNEWALEVAKALDKSGYFIVFISSNSIESRNVRDEINFALNHNKTLLAIHLENTDLPPALELRIASIQAIMRFRMDTESYIRKLEKVITRFRSENGISSLNIGEDGLLKGFQNTPFTLSNNSENVYAFYDQIKQFHKENNWLKIREIGPAVGQALIDNLNSSNDKMKYILKLIDLGVFMTDANMIIWARNCFDKSSGYFLDYMTNNGDDLESLDYLGMIYNNIGRMLRKNNSQSRSAESFYRKSLEIFDKLYPSLSDDPDLGDRLGMAFLNLGRSLSSQRKEIAANECFQKALITYQQILADYPENQHVKKRVEETMSLIN